MNIGSVINFSIIYKLGDVKDLYLKHNLLFRSYFIITYKSTMFKTTKTLDNITIINSK